MTRRLLVLLVVALAWPAWACSKTPAPTAPTPAAPTTDIFNSHIAVGGTASRVFVLRNPGTFSVTLTRVGPPPDVVVGLGVGVPRPDGTGCVLTRWVATTAATTPQHVVTADAGTYCVRIFDIGHLTGDVSFSITVDRL